MKYLIISLFLSSVFCVDKMHNYSFGFCKKINESSNNLIAEKKQNCELQHFKIPFPKQNLQFKCNNLIAEKKQNYDLSFQNKDSQSKKIKKLKKNKKIDLFLKKNMKSESTFTALCQKNEKMNNVAGKNYPIKDVQIINDNLQIKNDNLQIKNVFFKKTNYQLKLS